MLKTKHLFLCMLATVMAGSLSFFGKTTTAAVKATDSHKVILDFDGRHSNRSFDVDDDMVFEEYLDDNDELKEEIASYANDGEICIGINTKKYSEYDSYEEYLEGCYDAMQLEIEEDTTFYIDYYAIPSEPPYEFEKLDDKELELNSNYQPLGGFVINEMAPFPYYSFYDEEDFYSYEYGVYFIEIKDITNAQLVNVKDSNDKVDLEFFQDAVHYTNAVFGNNEFEFKDYGEDALISTIAGNQNYIFIDSLATDLTILADIDSKSSFSDLVVFVNGEESEHQKNVKNAILNLNPKAIVFVNSEGDDLGSIRYYTFTENPVPICEVIKSAGASLKTGTKHTTEYGVDYYTGSFEIKNETKYPEFFGDVYSGDWIGEPTNVFVKYDSSKIKANSTYEYVISYNLSAYSMVDFEEGIGFETKTRYSIPQTTKLTVSTKTTWTVSFDANGGSGSMAEVEVAKDPGTYILPTACDFVAPGGKTFDGWMIGNVKKAGGEEINVSSDTKIAAVWRDLAKFVVTYKSNNSNNEQFVIADVLENSVYTLLANTHFDPEDGKQFKCWEVNDIEKQPGDKIEITSNIDIKAIWTPAPSFIKEVTDESLALGIDSDYIFANAKADEQNVIFKTNSITVEFDKDAVKEIGGKTPVSFKAFFSEDIEGSEKVINLVLDNATFASGTAKVTFAFDKAVPNGMTAKLYHIDGETRNEVEATFENGTVIFSTNHFSKYAVVFEKVPTKGLPAVGIVFIILGSLILVGLVGFVVYWFIIKKKPAKELWEKTKEIFFKVWNWIKKTAIAFAKWVKKISIKFATWVKSLFKKKEKVE